jgi:hypothetical protein
MQSVGLSRRALCAQRRVRQGRTQEWTAGSVRLLGEFTADLALDDLAQGDVLEGELLQRIDQRLAAAPELFHAARHHVDQNVGLGDDGAGFEKVIVS